MMAPEAIARDFNLFKLSDEFFDDPYPTYRALREYAPVKWLSDNSVILTRHADVLSVYRDTDTFSSDKRREFAPKFGTESRLYQHHTTSLVFNDAPYHSRIRRTIMGALIPRALSRLEPKLVALVDRLLDEAAAKTEIDAIADFAGAIPVEVIGDLLCIPDEDRRPLRRWSLAILGALEPAPTPESLDKGEESLAQFHAYLSGLIADRRRHPRDPAHDVLTRLLQTGGEPLSPTELSENCVFLLNAGHETTSNLIGNALELLARFPDQRNQLSDEPKLLPPSIEEVLRFESSNQLGNRLTTCDVKLDGVTLPKGCFVTLAIGAANRDPCVFEAAETFHIRRTPNPHLAFAAGPHQCAGMNVARLEARIAIGRFLRKFPRFDVIGRPVRNRRARFRGFATLPVRVC